MYWFLCFILLMGERGSTTTVVPQHSVNGSDNTITETKGSPTTNGTQQPSPPAATTTKPTTRQPSASETKPMSSTLQNPIKTQKPCAKDNNGDCSFFLSHINSKLALLIIGALSVACIVLLTATLLLACKVCCRKKQVLDTTQSTPRRLSVDGESAPMITEISKPEGDENHSGPEEQEKPEEPEKPIEEAAEATEVSNQASVEDPTAAESPPNQECEAPETITFDDAEQP